MNHRNLLRILVAGTLLSGPCLISAGEEVAPKEYSIEPFNITLDGAGEEQLRLSLEYNYRTIWEGVSLAPGQISLCITANTDFAESPSDGYAEDECIYIYIRSEHYATQWHLLRLKDGALSLDGSPHIELYRKRYAIIEYEYYAGDDRSFDGRTPTHSGIAAVGHWGELPGFGSDWQIWQGRLWGGLWGKTLLLEHHRGNKENGMIEERTAEFTNMVKAPDSGYVHFGGCGVSSEAVAVGKRYYCRVTGHTKSTRGYGKLHIRDVCDTPPDDMKILNH